MLGFSHTLSLQIVTIRLVEYCCTNVLRCFLLEHGRLTQMSGAVEDVCVPFHPGFAARLSTALRACTMPTSRCGFLKLPPVVAEDAASRAATRRGSRCGFWSQGPTVRVKFMAGYDAQWRLVTPSGGKVRSLVERGVNNSIARIFNYICLD